MPIALLLTQAVAGPVLPAPVRPRIGGSCPADAAPGDVVVCARDPDQYRLKPLPAGGPADPALPKAEIGLGRTKLAAEAEAAGLPGGIPVNRLMVRWKIPLGGKGTKR